MAMMKHINAYRKGNRDFFVIELDNGEKVFINLAIIKYAYEHIKEVKEKESK